MSSGQRSALLVGAVVVAVAAFLILQPADDSEPTRQATQPAGETSTAPAATNATADQPEPAPKPDVTRIRVRGGEPVGGEAEVTVSNGDPIRLLVTSDVSDQVHVHGFDLSKPVGPGQPARISFKANIEGIFEVELEERAVPIAKLEVRP